MFLGPASANVYQVEGFGCFRIDFWFKHKDYVDKTRSTHATCTLLRSYLVSDRSPWEKETDSQVAVYACVRGPCSRSGWHVSINCLGDGVTWDSVLITRTRPWKFSDERPRQIFSSGALTFKTQNYIHKCVLLQFVGRESSPSRWQMALARKKIIYELLKWICITLGCRLAGRVTSASMQISNQFQLSGRWSGCESNAIMHHIYIHVQFYKMSWFSIRA